MADSQTLLVNFWYAHPVGHAVEALRYSLGYRRADPSLRVSLALNGASAIELGTFCSWIERTYAVAHTGFLEADADVKAALNDLPRAWDWVVDDARGHDDAQLVRFAGLRAYYAAAAKHFEPRRGHGIAGAPPPPYLPHQQVVLELPQRASVRATPELRGGDPRISIMPAGSGMRSAYPSVASWRLVVRALRHRFPEAVFCLIGKLRRDERTSTSMTRDELAQLVSACPRVVTGFDRPLAEQLALAQACDLFVSPHTGFGMAVLCVGTPWLTIAGGPRPEYFFNGVPFVSVLPDPRRFPCYEGLDTRPAERRIPSMTLERILEDLPQLVDGAARLIGRQLSYEDALLEHFRALLQFHDGDRTRIWSIDGIHEQYI